MMGRRVAALGAGLALVASVTVATARVVHDSSKRPGNASRFLSLTGDATWSISEFDAGSQQVDAEGDPAPTAASTSGDRTPMGWLIRPAGRQVDVLRFPLGITASPDGKSVVVSSDSGGVQGLTVIDSGSLAAAPTTAANLFTGVVVTPGGRVFASGGNADRVYQWQLIGPVAVGQDVTEAQPFPYQNEWDSHGGPASPIGDGIGVPGYPGGMALDGNLLYVAGTVAEAKDASGCPGGRDACSNVTIIDTATSKVVGRVPVGLEAFGLAIDSARHRLYVSNWADEAGRGSDTGGTVSVVDISVPAHAHELFTTGVGHHPSALQLSSDRRTLFVANTNDDSISVLDVSGAGAPTVSATESVEPLGAAPGKQNVGAHPDAFALSPDGSKLFVALAGMNAVEVRDGGTGARLAGQPKYIPTAWYPSALTVTAKPDGTYRLWVANAKGTGPGAGGNGTVFFDGTKTGGTVSAIDLPASDTQLNEWTDQVRENDQLDQLAVDACDQHAMPAGITVSAVLCPGNGQSPIKHVLYIVTENKTFDQYFGDINQTGGSGYDASPALTLYGQPVTTNHHALAARYSLADRFFSDAEVSVTGHSWTSGGIATDHNERTWPADYDENVRGNHGNADPHRAPVGGSSTEAQVADSELKDPEKGYIFEAFKQAGAVDPATYEADAAAGRLKPGEMSMGIYGEHTARVSGNMEAYKARGTGPAGGAWKDGDIGYFDTCRAQEFITGAASNGPLPEVKAPADVPVIGGPSLSDCQGRTLDAQFTLAHWNQVLADTGHDVMPNFIYMSLPVNHTMAANLGSPTPASMVADNDYAIGQIVDALSHSAFWGSTAVFVTEDDTQVAADHVSALRDYLQVISPWAKPGANHQWGSMPSLLRTIETIFGVPPFTLNDKVALPMHSAFVTNLTDTRDTAPYAAVAPAVPFAINEPDIVSSELAQASASMNFTTFDKVDEVTLNNILYAIGKGMTLEEAAAFLRSVTH
jgi:DNA-binding beta-propeller fold protein YncE